MGQNPYLTRLIALLAGEAVRSDGPFTLASGAVSAFYVDARRVTFDAAGAALVGRAVHAELDPSVEALGGMTMGADPVAIATAVVSAESDRPVRAFSIRKEAKAHGTGGRLVGAIRTGDHVAVIEDTTTTGSAFLEAVGVLEEAGTDIVQAIVLVDRSDGVFARLMAERGIAYRALATPADLGVG